MNSPALANEQRNPAKSLANTKSSSPGSAEGPPEPVNAEPSTRPNAPVLADPLLALAADVLDDLERVRIANENRLRQLTRTETDADGEERGFGLDERHPAVARLAALVDALKKAEHDAELNLKRHMRQSHPLGSWIEGIKGIGLKQGARLLAAIGDPYWNDLHQRPRKLYELYAYCGYHVVPVGHASSEHHIAAAFGDSSSARQGTLDSQTADAGGTLLPTDQACLDNHSRNVGGDHAGGDTNQTTSDSQEWIVGVAASRKRGQKANWSATAKSRCYLIAVSIVKSGGPYRTVYDQARAKYATATHCAPCVRCGPQGKPALPGSPLSAGHQHARALRLVSKAVLKDLWQEARRIHHGEPSPATIGGLE